MNIVLVLLPLAVVLLFATSAGGTEIPPGRAEKTPKELQVAADAGDSEAQFLLGRAYWRGIGVIKDRPKAVELYRKAAEKNHGEALAGLGAAYALGMGVEKKDERLAAEYARKAAEQGSAIGQLNYGAALMLGRVVEKNTEEGVKWVVKAAEQGLAQAQMRVADFYVTGDFGKPRDYDQAIIWARKAVDQNEPTALNLYGIMLRDGMGTKRDPAASIPYFQRAADQNNLKAYINLGMAYFNGHGVKRDRITGMSWWFAGEILGDRMCREVSDREIGSVTIAPEDIQKAKQLGQKLANERAGAFVKSRLERGI